jgi:membrane associated rhomboid family serine protease
MSYQPRGFSLLPEVIKNLLIINGLFFLGTVVLGDSLGINLYDTLALYMPGSESFQPFQLVSHMFMHGNFGHILFNMFALWMFGYALENVWGGKRFLIYYMITGLGAALIHLGWNYFELMQVAQNVSPDQIEMVIREGGQLLANNQNYVDPNLAKINLIYNIPTVGASGAVFGILLAFGMMFPNTRIYLYFAFPIKAKYFVIGYGLLELFNGIANDPSSNVAHFAHLGGMLFGFLLIKYWKRKGYWNY